MTEQEKETREQYEQEIKDVTEALQQSVKEYCEHHTDKGRVENTINWSLNMHAHALTGVERLRQAVLDLTDQVEKIVKNNKISL